MSVMVGRQLVKDRGWRHTEGVKPPPSPLARPLGWISATACVSWVIVLAAHYFRPPLTALTTNLLATMMSVSIGSSLVLVLLGPVYLVSVLSGSAPAPALGPIPEPLRRLWATEFWKWGSAPFLLLPATCWYMGVPTQLSTILAATAFGAGFSALRMAREVVESPDASPPGSPLVVEPAAALRPVTVGRTPPWLARARRKAAHAVLTWPWGLYVTAAFFAAGQYLDPVLGWDGARAVTLSGFFCAAVWALSAPSFLGRLSKGQR